VGAQRCRRVNDAAELLRAAPASVGFAIRTGPFLRTLSRMAPAAAPATHTSHTTRMSTTTQRRGGKATQRKRLLAGMIAAANREGYARASVTAVIAQAGVSRPTFYDYFSDKDDCFLAALADVHERLLQQVGLALLEEAPERAMHATARALVGFAGSHPAMGRFLTNEPMAGGPALLDARDRGIAAIEQAVQERCGRAEPDASAPGFSGRILIGAFYRLIASRLRRGDPAIATLRDDLLAWIDSYCLPLEEHRWRPLGSGPTPPPSPFVPDLPLHAPDPLPPGRPRVPDGEAAENQRQRIMFAAAELAEEKGYAATTVAEITRVAGVDGRVFYAMFTDKQDAFMAVHEFGFQHVMDVTAAAFFSGATWPERHWEAGRAFTHFLERNPLVARVGFVEAYAVGPGAAQRLEDSQAAFAMLMQEGYQYVPPDAAPSRVVLEAVIAAIFEIVYDRARDSGEPRLPELLPHMTFLVLAPFIGPVAADAFIDKKLS
jgi:AcrR family transcriptional regulator